MTRSHGNRVAEHNQGPDRQAVYMIRDAYRPPKALYRRSALGEHFYRDDCGWQHMILVGNGLMGNPDFDDISEAEAREFFPGAFGQRRPLKKVFRGYSD